MSNKVIIPTFKPIRMKLLNYLDRLPIYNLSKLRLERVVNRDCSNRADGVKIIYDMSRIFKQYEASYVMGDKRAQYKLLQSLLWNIYFQWDNIFRSPRQETSNHRSILKYPPHLRPLLRTSAKGVDSYEQLLDNWPLEYHYNILRDEGNDSNNNSSGNGREGKKKLKTLRNMWIQGEKNVVQCSLTHVSNHHGSHPTEGKIHDMRKIIEPILTQIYFLNTDVWGNNNNNNGLKSQKPIIPILEVPLTVHGVSIPRNRTKNMIKDKLNQITQLLIRQWPALYDEDNINEMLALLHHHHSDVSRDVRRCYERSFCGKMYRLHIEGASREGHVFEHIRT